MKRIMSMLTCLVLLGSLTNLAGAQTTPATSTNQQTNQEPRALSDKALSGRLQTDLNSRNSSLGTQPVSWYDAGYGYYGTYSQNDQNYMVRYDRQGNYVETLNRKEWNDQIAPATRDAFTNSTYKDQRVTGYWEVTDTGRKGSYYELSDSKGTRSRVWADDKGKFTTQPAVGTTPRSNP